jgi:hypothetical protein
MLGVEGCVRWREGEEGVVLFDLIIYNMSERGTLGC